MTLFSNSTAHYDDWVRPPMGEHVDDPYAAFMACQVPELNPRFASIKIAWDTNCKYCTIGLIAFANQYPGMIIETGTTLQSIDSSLPMEMEARKLVDYLIDRVKSAGVLE